MNLTKHVLFACLFSAQVASAASSLSPLSVDVLGSVRQNVEQIHAALNLMANPEAGLGTKGYMDGIKFAKFTCTQIGLAEGRAGASQSLIQVWTKLDRSELSAAEANTRFLAKLDEATKDVVLLNGQLTSMKNEYCTKNTINPYALTDSVAYATRLATIAANHLDEVRKQLPALK